MAPQAAIYYVAAKSRVVLAITRVTTFIKAYGEYNNDRANLDKHAKIKQMLVELKDIRRCVNEHIQIMETSVGQGTAPTDITDNSSSDSLIGSFETLFYELAAFADIHTFSLSPVAEMSNSFASRTSQQPGTLGNLSCFQLPKRTFPTFFGIIAEFQGFEDLFKSILSHAEEISNVKKFEILKLMSLQGEALSLVTHLPITALNYDSAWEILKSRYGNKRDLARTHIQSLLTNHSVKSNDALSIKTLVTSLLNHTAALDNLGFVTKTWSPLLLYIFEQHLDYELRSQWELTVGYNHAPTLSEFVHFLRQQLRSAEVFSTTRPSSMQLVSLKPKQERGRSGSFQKNFTTTTSQSVNVVCPMCNESHSIRKCPQFMEKPSNERFQLANKITSSVSTALEPGTPPQLVHPSMNVKCVRNLTIRYCILDSRQCCSVVKPSPNTYNIISKSCADSSCDIQHPMAFQPTIVTSLRWVMGSWGDIDQIINSTIYWSPQVNGGRVNDAFNTN